MGFEVFFNESGGITIKQEDDTGYYDDVLVSLTIEEAEDLNNILPSIIESSRSAKLEADDGKTDKT